MKPMTPDEFEHASDVKPIWKYNYTTLPATIIKIHKQHFYMATKIELWLNRIGCKTSNTYYAKKGIKQLRERLMEVTCFEIKIRHANDYIEMGPTFDDPKGEMFNIITSFRVSPKFEPADILYVTQLLELFSQKKLTINKRLDKINLEFYSSQRKLNNSNCSAKWGGKLSYDLKFEIVHVWKSK